MKKYFCIILIALWIVFPLKVYAVDYKDEIDNIAEQYDINRDNIYNISINDIYIYIKDNLIRQRQEPIKLCVKMLALIMLSAVVKAIDVGDNINHTTDLLCAMMAFISLVKPVQQMLEIITAVLFDIKNFMVSFVPVFAGITLAAGEAITSSVTSGFFLTGIITVCNFCINIIIPSVQIYLAIIISSAAQNIIELKSLSEFYLKSVKWVLKSIVSIICFILTLQTTLTRPGDSLKIKAGKMIAGSTIPVIGSVLQDAVAGVYAGMEVIKGFAGVVGIMSVVNIFLPAMLLLITYYICFNLLYIACDMFSIKPASRCIKGFENIIELLISIIVIFVILFVFFLVIVITFTKGL